MYAGNATLLSEPYSHVHHGSRQNMLTLRNLTVRYTTTASWRCLLFEIFQLDATAASDYLSKPCRLAHDDCQQKVLTFRRLTVMYMIATIDYAYLSKLYAIKCSCVHDGCLGRNLPFNVFFSQVHKLMPIRRTSLPVNW
jgi:hypothetical protein